MESPLNPQQNPAGGGPVALNRDAYHRVRDAVRYVETFRRNRVVPGKGLNAFIRPSSYAFLAAGATISAPSGSTLGSGSVTLCSRSGATVTADGETVTVYNAGGSVSGGGSGKYVKVGWCDGDWSVDVAPC